MFNEVVIIGVTIIGVKVVIVGVAVIGVVNVIGTVTKFAIKEIANRRVQILTIPDQTDEEFRHA
ncbi:hypothetical protein C2G38_2182188 [Gigaspora rosea]|uniref:Uncharacterized protein n=1 Tax=Gigaspora rosea TaxID=44941 RepID=A0A397VA03_9GLOM|nr:hypothetical protein C2G38_2182188 [Gigaspora rosea]